MRLQPSEIAKLATIIALAYYAEYHQRQMGRFKYGLLIPGAGLACMLGLILAGKDYGTTLLLATVCGMMLVIAGARLRYLVPIVLACALVFGLAIWHNPVRRARVMAWLNPEQHTEGTGYQAWQAMIALGFRRAGRTWSGQWPAETRLRARASHRFYFVGHWGRTGRRCYPQHRRRVPHHSGLRHAHRVPRARSLRHVPRCRHHVPHRPPGIY